MITAASAELIRLAAPLVKGLDGTDLRRAVQEAARRDGAFITEDVSLAWMAFDELGVDGAVALADREFPCELFAAEPGEDLFHEFSEAWTAVPFREPDITAFLGRAEAEGPLALAFFRGAIFAFLSYGPSPVLSEDQRAERLEWSRRLMERLSRSRRVDQWLGLDEIGGSEE